MKLGAFLSLVLTVVAGVTCHPRGSPHPPAVCLPEQWSGALVLDTSSCSTEQLTWNINLADSVAVDYEASRFALNLTSGNVGIIVDTEKQCMWNIDWGAESCQVFSPIPSVGWPSLLGQQCVPENSSEPAITGYLGMQRQEVAETLESLGLFLSKSSSPHPQAQRLDVEVYQIYREDKQAEIGSLSLITLGKENHSPVHEKLVLVAEGKIQSVLGMGALNVTDQVNPSTLQPPPFCKPHSGQDQAAGFNLAEHLQVNFNGFRL